MVGCLIDANLKRMEVGGFKFPLGVYPVEDMTPRAGYTLNFEPADGDDEGGDWEEWPDRYVFDAVLSAERVPALCRLLLSLLPGRVYPILDVLGHDAFREVDPYIAYETVPVEVFTDAIRRFKDFFFEDGMCGFGAMAEEPFLYVFVDEHKIVTIRAEPTLKERVEKLLKAFDLEQIEEPAGADAASHEHRTVLLMPEDKPELLGVDEIVEQLRDRWQLVLNVDPDTNLDDEGKDLGITAWRCVVRVENQGQPAKYAELLLHADCLRVAEEAAMTSVEKLAGKKGGDPEDLVIVASDRLTAEMFDDMLAALPKKVKRPSPGPVVSGVVKTCRWL